MSDDDDGSHSRKLFRNRARLLGIAGVIAGLKLELFPKHAAGGIDIGDGLNRS